MTMATAKAVILTIRTTTKHTTTKATTMMGLFTSLGLFDFNLANVRLSGYYTADGQAPYQQDAYYDGNQGYQDEYYDGQYYDQGVPAQQAQYGQNGYRYVV